MLRSLRRRLTYANVMSTIAVFAVLAGGSAYAANTIRSTDIVDGEVKSADVANQDLTGGDIKDGSLTTFDLADGAGVTGADILDDSVTNADIKNFSLGNGDFLDGSVDSRVVTNNSLQSSDLGTASVGSDEVTNDSLTGADINESTLNVAHIPTTASFSFVTPGESNDDTFIKVISKTVPAGDYVFLATINTTGCPGCFLDSHVFDAECQLRNPSGSVIGGTTDRRYVPSTDNIKRSLSFNGGASLPSGGTVTVWCRGQIQEDIDNGQLLTLRVDGFN